MHCDKCRHDGLDDPAAITMPARHLLAVVCRLGGADCPLLSAEQADTYMRVLHTDPTATIRLTSDADKLPHYTQLSEEDYQRRDPAEVLNRKRDLDVLQSLGLVPGDTRRARYLYELLLERVQSPWGICAHETPGWEGCPLARSGAYEAVREKGWQGVVHLRTDEERAEYREANVQAIDTGDRIYMRPHHIMCLACWYNGGAGTGLRGNDTLAEILDRVRRDPEVPIVLVEGPCSACDCCDGFHPETGRCVHACGLIRDYLKDLECFQMLGMMPGDSMPGRKLFEYLLEKIPSTRYICAYGTGEVTSQEWRICNSPDGSPGYAKTRETGFFED